MCKKHLCQGGFSLLGHENEKNRLKKCFWMRKFLQKFTSMAFTQELERGINFRLLKRMNGIHSVSTLSGG